MKRTLIIFICALFVAADALFSFPAISWFDRWAVGIAGAVIAILSFLELRKFPLRGSTHDEEPPV